VITMSFAKAVMLLVLLLATLAPLGGAAARDSALTECLTTLSPGQVSWPASTPRGDGAGRRSGGEAFGFGQVVGPVIDDVDSAGRGPGRFAYADTLWIFDADFEDLSDPDNQGWLSQDRSALVPGFPNHWHKDTLRTGGYPYLGDSTWWCGTYCPCWAQPRGYGNDWMDYLWRDFALSTWSDGGDTVVFEWDQRFAMERYYDYGYVDVSADGGLTWDTIVSYTNGGFTHPGQPRDWDHPTLGHQAFDMSAHAGSDIRVRFRFESDPAYSCQEQPDNPPLHSLQDGAWQLDNLTWTVNGTEVWRDDCEAPGDNEWVHEDIPDVGLVGVVYARVYEDIDGPGACDRRSGWMVAAYDTTGSTVDRQNSVLVSPAIETSGIAHLIVAWDAWMDIPVCSNVGIALWLYGSDHEECWVEQGFFEPVWGWYAGGPMWVSDAVDRSGTSDWLRAIWQLRSFAPAGDPACHHEGFIVDRMRAGIAIGGARTEYEYSPWSALHDVFGVEEVQVDSLAIRITDEDGVIWAYLLASDDRGATWESYELIRDGLEGDWIIPPPLGQIAPATEVWYYFEAMDGYGYVSTYPWSAPEEHLEFSILPIHGSLAEPGILLVDKHDGKASGEHRDYRHTTEYYLREALGIAGFVCDTYDVAEPGSGTHCSDGPDTSGMGYYDTQVWFSGSCDDCGLSKSDQLHLVQWLSGALEGRERNLLLCGSDLNARLADAGQETLDFQTAWLATEFLSDTAGDTLMTLRDVAGGFDFMTYDDGECIVAAGCPVLGDFDAVGPIADSGAELVAEYAALGRTGTPAGVAYTDTVVGYQAVNLGFGVEAMMDAALPSGAFLTGAADRSDLVGNIMEYFGKTPAGPGTGVPDPELPTCLLGRPYPNPTTGEVTVRLVLTRTTVVSARVFDLAGRLVQTMSSSELHPGEHVVNWDGLTASGTRAASGVYFIRLETGDGTTTTQKTVLLR
jgi:hypothetical protein